VLELSIKSLLAYLLGALIGSLLVGRVRGVDIRTLGSGNAGGTNALRTQGPAFAAAVIAIDFGKALLAVGVLPKLVLPMVGIAPAVDREWLAVACAVAVVVGHVYPVWYEFRGGKGAATLIGAVAVLSPAALLPVLGVWLVCVMLTGYVGLSTMLGALTLPVWYAVMRPENTALVSFGVVMALFVAFTHRSNIQRMWIGSENRARRLWLLRPR
jgi:acyl phosphate:glycerol-3-phosphate acyltransferase